MKMNQCLFVGGAPRSGTTLLVRLFDWHPEVFAFPIEVPVLRKYWSLPQEEREAYFRERFFEKGQGKHVQFVDAEFLADEKRRLQQEFGTETMFRADPDNFLSQYNLALSKEGPLLQRAFSGLADGLRSSDNCAGLDQQSARYLLFKNPYYVELYAQDIAAVLPEAKFIHIIRSPMDRYLSAKTRRLRRGGHMMNGCDFVTGLSEVWISSRQLAADNVRVLGEERYRTLYYEKLVADPESEMRKLADWLGIAFAPSLLCPTTLGSAVEANSSFNAENKPMESHVGVDISRANRTDRFRDNTSLAERTLMYYLLKSASDLLDDYEIPDVTRSQARLHWLLPFSSEPIRRYLRRVIAPTLNPTAMSRHELQNMMANRLPALAREGKAQLL